VAKSVQNGQGGGGATISTPLNLVKGVFFRPSDPSHCVSNARTKNSLGTLVVIPDLTSIGKLSFFRVGGTPKRCFVN